MNYGAMIRIKQISLENPYEEASYEWRCVGIIKNFLKCPTRGSFLCGMHHLLRSEYKAGDLNTETYAFEQLNWEERETRSKMIKELVRGLLCNNQILCLYFVTWWLISLDGRVYSIACVWLPACPSQQPPPVRQCMWECQRLCTRRSAPPPMTPSAPQCMRQSTRRSATLSMRKSVTQCMKRSAPSSVIS